SPRRGPKRAVPRRGNARRRRPAPSSSGARHLPWRRRYAKWRRRHKTPPPCARRRAGSPAPGEYLRLRSSSSRPFELVVPEAIRQRVGVDDVGPALDLGPHGRNALAANRAAARNGVRKLLRSRRDDDRGAVSARAGLDLGIGLRLRTIPFLDRAGTKSVNTHG